MYFVVKLKKMFKNLFRLTLTAILTRMTTLASLIMQAFSITIESVISYHIDSSNIAIFTSYSVTNYYTLVSIIKVITLKDIIIYDNSNTRHRLEQIIDVYSSLWTNHDQVIDISEVEWMSIKIKSNVNVQLVKSYSLKRKDQKFDRLHAQEKMSWIIEFTSYEYLVFVVWRTIEELNERKNRIIIDIRDLNKLAEKNSYSIYLQSNIISAVRECRFITTVDCASFFHQW